jgi:hypothetical protein
LACAGSREERTNLSALRIQENFRFGLYDFCLSPHKIWTVERRKYIMRTGSPNLARPRLALIAVLLLGFSLLAVSVAVPTGGYPVTKKIPIPGQGSWDYLSVDEAARRLYVSHGTQVEVLEH